jgi:hypothetical protein
VIDNDKGEALHHAEQGARGHGEREREGEGEGEGRNGREEGQDEGKGEGWKEVVITAGEEGKMETIHHNSLSHVNQLFSTTQYLPHISKKGEGEGQERGERGGTGGRAGHLELILIRMINCTSNSIQFNYQQKYT